MLRREQRVVELRVLVAEPAVEDDDVDLRAVGHAERVARRRGTGRGVVVGGAAGAGREQAPRGRDDQTGQRRPLEQGPAGHAGSGEAWGLNGILRLLGFVSGGLPDVAGSPAHRGWLISVPAGTVAARAARSAACGRRLVMPSPPVGLASDDRPPLAR